MHDDILLPLILLGIPAVVILTPLLLRSWERRRILDAVMAASNAGQPVPAHLIEALIAGSRKNQPEPSRVERDFRRGFFLMATGLVFVAAGVSLYAIMRASGSDDAHLGGVALGAVGLFPGLIGAAYALLARQSRRDASRSLTTP